MAVGKHIYSREDVVGPYPFHHLLCSSLVGAFDPRYRSTNTPVVTSGRGGTVKEHSAVCWTFYAAIMIKTLVFVLSATCGALCANFCNYGKDDGCISPQITATAALPFGSLFTKSPAFVFAIDDLDSTEIESARQHTDLPIPGDYNGPVQAIGFWIQFEQNSLNFTPAADHIYVVGALSTNSSNALGGHDGGCQDALGTQCVAGLKASVQAGRGLAAITDLNTNPQNNLSCPDDLFADYLVRLQRKSQDHLVFGN